MDAELDISYIKGVIDTILCKTFPAGSEKRRSLIKEKGIEFACPICGDSQKNPRAKRGFMFFGSLQFKCLNEECRSTLTGLCRDNDVQLDPEKKMQIFEYLDQQIASGAYRHSSGDEFIIDSLDKLISIETLQEYFDGGGFLNAFRPITKRDIQYKYLTERGMPERVISEMYAARMVITPRWQEDCIVFLNRSANGKILGMQTRNMKSGDERRFKIYNFEYLYNELHPDAPIDPIDAVPYNKLSYLFNILRVDFDRPITVFEGYLDAAFFPNSIGAVGTETDFGFLTAEGVDVRFFFDNDGAGHWKSRKYMQKGFQVFLWEKFVEDRIRAVKGDPMAVDRALRSLKDLNAMAKATPGGDPVTTFKLERFFSANDGMDLHYIPSPSKADKEAYKNRKKKGALTTSSTVDDLARSLSSLSW